jgi:hypothetical protein
MGIPYKKNTNILENPSFKRWFGTSKIRTRNSAIIVFHGTLSDFSKFDIVKHRSGFVGPGFYFTSSTADVNRNYATLSGGDVTNHIELYKDNMPFDERNQIVYDYCVNHGISYNDSGWKTEKAALDEYFEYHPEILTQHFGITNQGSVMPCYLKMEKPCIMGFGKRDTWFNYKYDTKDEDNPEESGDALTILDVMSGYENSESTNHSYADLCDYISDKSGIDASELMIFISRGWEYDEEQWYMLPFKEILQDLGYDGVILNARRFFGTGPRTTGYANMKGVQQAIHYIVWEPNQIKSAIGNHGTFDGNSADIRESKRNKH